MDILRVVFVVLLSLMFSHAKAETIAATPPSASYDCSVSQAACNALHGQYGRVCYELYTKTSTAATWKLSKDGALIGQSGFFEGCSPGVYTCPAGGNWTLDGINCTRPDCVSPQVRQSDGTCAAPKCVASQETTFSLFSGFNVGKGKVIAGGSANPFANPTNRCNDDGCVINVTSVKDCPAVVGTVDKPLPITCYGFGVMTGATCTPSADTSTSTPSVVPDVPNTKPVCKATEGVLTTSSGTVACIPAGVPSQVPVVQKKSDVTVYPDGSTKTTDTTYTKDPATQVQATNQTVTTTGVGGGTGSGATAGQAGAVGTTGTTGSASASGGSGAGGTDDSGNSSLCKDSPTLDICNNKLNKEETQVKISESIDKVKDSLSAEGFEAKDHLPDGMADSNDAKEALKGKVDEFVDGVKEFGTGADIAAGSYSEFRETMGGWLDSVPSSSCSPFDFKIGPWMWHFDHCPVAAKISEIGAYCMWVMLVFGIFSMVTREGK